MILGENTDRIDFSVYTPMDFDIVLICWYIWVLGVFGHLALLRQQTQTDME